MPVLKVVEGKLSNKYNHFMDYRFDSCVATNTRLMGVVALKVSWTAKDEARISCFSLSTWISQNMEWTITERFSPRPVIWREGERSRRNGSVFPEGLAEMKSKFRSSP